MLCIDKSIQAGSCWIVDTDSTVVKYCDDNIVTITVPGHAAHGDGQDSMENLAIVAHNTLRLRIVPGKDYEHYQEIPEDDDEYYDYCLVEETPPPLPPREDTFHQNTFQMGRKNILRKLDFDTDLDSSDGKAELQMSKGDKGCRKDLRKYLGVSDNDWRSVENAGGTFKKDLSKFLGIRKRHLGTVLSKQSHRKAPNKLSCDGKFRSKLEKPYQETASEEGSEGYSSIELSSSSSGSCTASLEYYSCSHRLVK